MKIFVAAFLLGQAAAPSFQIENNALVLPKPIAFAGGAHLAVNVDNKDALDHVAAYAAAKSYLSTLRVEAHVAVAGKEGQLLSEQRAMEVARALVARGVDCKRLLPVGFGDTKPVADPSTAEGKAKNTRIEIVNAALRNIAIGGMPLDGGGRVAGDVCAAPKG